MGRRLERGEGNPSTERAAVRATAVFYYLIDHSHIIFRGEGNAEVLRRQVERAVREVYPVPATELGSQRRHKMANAS